MQVQMMSIIHAYSDGLEPKGHNHKNVVLRKSINTEYMLDEKTTWCGKFYFRINSIVSRTT